MKRRTETVAGGDDDVLPFELVRRGLSADEFLQQIRAQCDWFRARGINPGDWSAVYPELRRAWAAHGIPSSLDRAAARSWRLAELNVQASGVRDCQLEPSPHVRERVTP